MTLKRAEFSLVGVMALLASAAVPVGAQEHERSFDWTPLRAPQHLAQAQPSSPALEPDSQQELQIEASEGKAAALAKEAQNPIANLTSLPIQWNATPGTQWAPTSVDPSASHNQTLHVVNVQPVVPFKVSKDLTIVTRTIAPFVSQPWSSGSALNGLGDINPSLFFVPTLKGDVTVGVGPTMILPTATDRERSSKRWSAGPTGVLVVTKGPWVLGGLANNVWSFAGEKGQPVSQMLIQPFLNYNLPKGWYLTSSPIITANWNNPTGRGWTVPIGAGVGRVFKLGQQPINASLSAYWHAQQAEIDGEQLLGDVTIRAQVQFLFPKRPRS